MRLEAVGVLVVEGEQRPAVLQREAEFARHDLRAEAEVVALDQRAAVAVLVDDRQIDRVAVPAVAGRPAGTSTAALFGIDPLPLLSRRTPSRSARPTGTSADRRVGVELGAVGKGELLGLDEQVQILRRCWGPLPARSYASSMLSICSAAMPLAVRRQFPDVVAAVVRRDRLDPFAACDSKVRSEKCPPFAR